MKSYWIIAVGLLLPTLAFASTEIRISTPSGLSLPTTLEVSPGENVNLSANLYSEDEGVDSPAGEFLWTADSRPHAPCDLYSASHCMATTEFRPLPSGVAYQVPAYFNQPITITASLRGGGLVGSIRLVPRPVVTYYSAPPPIIYQAPRPIIYRHPRPILYRPPVIIHRSWHHHHHHPRLRHPKPEWPRKNDLWNERQQKSEWQALWGRPQRPHKRW